MCLGFTLAIAFLIMEVAGLVDALFASRLDPTLTITELLLGAQTFPVAIAVIGGSVYWFPL